MGADEYASSPPYGQSAARILEDARNFAYNSRHEFVRTDHLLAGIIRQGGCNMTLVGLKAPPLQLFEKISQSNSYGCSSVTCTTTAGAAHLPPSGAYNHIQNKHAPRMALLLGREEIDPDSLLGSLLMLDECLGAQILHRQGVTLAGFLKRMKRYAGAPVGGL